MVVHIRRGDVDLCDQDLEFRYLPNSHYAHLIQEFSDKDMEVSVYSEPKSTEPWNDDDLLSLIDHLYLDASLVDNLEGHDHCGRTDYVDEWLFQRSRRVQSSRSGYLFTFLGNAIAPLARCWQ
jgi:hypothetical protein